MLNKLIVGLALGCASTSLLAQTAGSQLAPASGGYAQDGNGAVMKSGDGLCWRSGSWTPDAAVTGCDGALVPPIATKPIAPAIATTSAQMVPPLMSAPVARCDFTVTLQGKLFFGFNKATLSTAAKNQIDDDVLNKLGTCAIDTILVTGHADRLGTAQYNEKLSSHRADTVASYLKNKGISTAIETRGLGATQPVKTCNDKLEHKNLTDCLAPNRRVIIDVRGIIK
ncbi:MAG TPA: OmpA family protein [Burkholderiaceae bacterium]|nr:OmpA family protein [Burkholderiaceae bacterium]